MLQYHRRLAYTSRSSNPNESGTPIDFVHQTTLTLHVHMGKQSQMLCLQLFHGFLRLDFAANIHVLLNVISIFE